MTFATATYRVNLRDRRVRRVTAPDVPTRGPTHPTARLLALAHLVERAVLAGRVRDYSAAAVAVGLSQPRLASVLGLIFLSPRIQERILTGDLAISDNRLRPVLKTPTWSKQQEACPAQHKH